MKIGVIQASSQKEKNEILFQSVKDAVEKQGCEVINFGVFPDEEEAFSYIEIAVCISFLLESGAVDFVVTGCSSGQGMMLACNSLPGILCGYVENPADAYLFGRINDGNAVSYPLGLNFGWAGELNLKSTMCGLFEEPFGIGYPPKDAGRKQRDTKMLKRLNVLTKRSLADILSEMDEALIRAVLRKRNVCDYILEHGRDRAIGAFLEEMRG